VALQFFDSDTIILATYYYYYYYYLCVQLLLLHLAMFVLWTSELPTYPCHGSHRMTPASMAWYSVTRSVHVMVVSEFTEIVLSICHKISDSVLVTIATPP